MSLGEQQQQQIPLLKKGRHKSLLFPTLSIAAVRLCRCSPAAYAPRFAGRRVKSMAKVMLASSLTRWLPEAERGAQGELSVEVDGDTIDQALDSLFLLHPSLRGYVLDEQGTVRHHVAVIVDGEAIRDKRNLGQPLGERGELYIMQALSGG